MTPEYNNLGGNGVFKGDNSMDDGYYISGRLSNGSSTGCKPVVCKDYVGSNPTRPTNFIYHKEPVQRCLIEEFFKNEQNKPPHLRSNSCLICCPCPKCNRVMC